MVWPVETGSGQMEPMFPPSGTFHQLNCLSIYGTANWDPCLPFWNIPSCELLVHSWSVLLGSLFPQLLEHSSIRNACPLMVFPVRTHGLATWNSCSPFLNLPPPELLIHSWHNQLGPMHCPSGTFCHLTCLFTHGLSC